MGEFRIGRTFARHSYPNTPRSGGLTALASNYAFGPGANQPIAVALSGTPAFTDTNGSAVEAGALTAQGAPITPNVTGDVTVEATVNVINTTEGAVSVLVYLQVNGVTSGAPVAAATLDALGYESIPISFGPTHLALGVTAHVNLILVASGAGLLLTTSSAGPTITAASAMFLQEVQAATG